MKATRLFGTALLAGAASLALSTATFAEPHEHEEAHVAVHDAAR